MRLIPLNKQAFEKEKIPVSPYTVKTWWFKYKKHLDLKVKIEGKNYLDVEAFFKKFRINGGENMNYNLGHLKRDLRDLKYAFNAKDRALKRIIEILHKKLDVEKTELSEDEMREIVVLINNYTDEHFNPEFILQKLNFLILN